MGRKKKLVNRSGIPDYEIEAIARHLMPDITDFFNSEEGQREFSEWKKKNIFSEK